MANKEGYIHIQSPLMPNNDNPRSWVSDINYIKGGSQVFADVEEMVAFHPFRMKPGMTATILNYPTAGTITDFRLGADPSTMVNTAKESVVTVDNFLEFWVIQSQTSAPSSRVYQYAPDAPGGGSPIFPYTLGTESVWSSVRDDSKGHRWLRFRDDDVDANEDGIYDNWSVPISIGAQFQTGDYEENRFKRQAVDTTPRTSTAGLVADKYYIVETGTITVTGDVEANEIGEYGDTTTAVITPGKTFKYVAGNSYTFNPASVQEVVKVPPKAINGLLNNEPAGWEDTIPAGTDQLWQISAQKSVYGQLKSAWILKKVVEDPDFIRYSNTPSPHPGTIAGRNDAVVGGGATDLALIAAGWGKTYNNQNFIATRALDPDPGFLYTDWIVEKINEESGEYQDRVFKLFDLNLDSDSPSVAAPTERDATKEGWSDAPLQETDTQINFVSEARKFFNGELKTPWSIPVPYTGKDIFQDIIDCDYDNFHYSDNGNVITPSLITLTAKLFKGLTDLAENEDLEIAYEWTRVYNDGDPDTTIATDDDTDDFYIATDDGDFRDGQRLFIKPTGVAGTAVFRVKQTLTLSTGNTIEFEEEISILDITDGLDAKSFDIKADNQLVLYDTTELVYSLAKIIIRAYWANLVGVELRWFKKTGATWTELTGAPYTIAGNTISVNPADIFAEDGTAEEATFACTTHPTEDDPENVDYDTYFSDFTTITKLGALAIGAPGENAIGVVLSNESHTIVLDKDSGSPQTGELAKASTTVRLFDGATEKLYGTDWSAIVASDNGDVTFEIVDSGDYATVTATAWGANEISAVATITITYGAKTIVKKFSVSTTKDSPGAIILDLDSNTGYLFTPQDRANKTLTAKLYNGTVSQTLPDGVKYEFRFRVANTWGSWAAANTKSITRANILVTGDVTCEVRKTGELTAFASRTVKFSDVLDGKTYRAFTQQVSQPTSGNYLTNQNPTSVFGAAPGFATGVTVGTATWYAQTSSFWTTNPNTQIWEQEAEEYIDTDNTAKWRWSTPKQIKGEAGSQGPQGNFVFSMYRALVPADPANPNDPAYTTPPALGNSNSNTASLAQMKAVGWLSKLPIGTTAVIWKTERMWNGEGVTFNSDGDPSTTPTSATAVWLAPVRISSKDGGKGDVGDQGAKGWSPQWAVHTEIVGGVTKKFLKMLGWFGGSGTPPSPSYENYFLGTTGFVASSDNAININGDPVEFRKSGTVLQWKYITEGSGSWRDIHNFTSENWIKSVAGGSASFTATDGRSIILDTGDATSKNLAITAYMDAGTDVDYIMRIEGNSVASSSGASLIIQRNYKTHGAGIFVRQYHLHINLTTTHRYIILDIGTAAGSGGLTGYFGLTVMKTN